jgi:hypothetical protein
MIQALLDAFSSSEGPSHLLSSFESLRLFSPFSLPFPPGLTDAQLIKISHGGTYYCLNSLTMCLGLFAQQKPSVQTIFKAALMGGSFASPFISFALPPLSASEPPLPLSFFPCSGDTDSNAAILGHMIGGLKGFSHPDVSPPEPFVKELDQATYLTESAKRFARTLSSSSAS